VVKRTIYTSTTTLGSIFISHVSQALQRVSYIAK